MSATSSMRAVILAGALVTTAASGAPGPQRVDLYDAYSRRQGYAVVDERRGRIDVYDKYSRRLGYGTIGGGKAGMLNPGNGRNARAR